jgi:hypothetical protein
MKKKRLEQTQILYELLKENKGYGDNSAYDQTVTGEHRTATFND